MGKASSEESPPTKPICRCRVMYLGSAVPHVTKDGLQGIQEPLRDLYPEHGVLANNGSSGIDSWLSVWSNGILVENVDDHGREVKRFYPIDSLHYCAAVRYVVIPKTSSLSNIGAATSLSTIGVNNVTSNASTLSQNSPNTSPSSVNKVAKFLPLDSPFSRQADASHPPLFACILRRTTGIKVLECHAFIAKREAAANALVRCCFHAYADTIHAKQIENESPYSQLNGRRSRSIPALDSVEKVEQWRHRPSNQSGQDERDSTLPEPGSSGRPINGHNNGHTNGGTNGGTNGNCSKTPDRTPSFISESVDDNYKVWTENDQSPCEKEVTFFEGNSGPNGTLRSIRSISASSIASTVIRTPRPRQLHAIPCPMPPPLPQMSTKERRNNKKVKESTLKKKHKYQGHIPAPLPPLPPHFFANGCPINFMPPPHAIYAPGSSIYSEGRRMARRRTPAPPPYHMMHHDGFPQPVSLIIGPGDEPIYIPSMRPITPNGHSHPLPPSRHHHDQPIFVQYGPYGPGPIPSSLINGTNSLSHRESVKDDKHRKKDKKSKSSPSDESPFNTGIYKRKGHLNERAFSYSIRQEHRSRSNSLSNLQFEAQDNDLNDHQHIPDSSLPITANGDAYMNGNGHAQTTTHAHPHASTPKNNINGINERELSDKLNGLEINRNGVSKKPPPPPPLPHKRTEHMNGNGIGIGNTNGKSNSNINTNVNSDAQHIQQQMKTASIKRCNNKVSQ